MKRDKFENADYDLTKLLKIKVNKFDYFIMPRYKHHYVDNEYEPFSVALVSSYLKRGDTFVDIGAHYGYYSLVAADKVGDNGKVIAYEPVPENSAILKKNIAENAFTKVIRIRHAAVADSNGKAVFNIPWASDNAGLFNHPVAETIDTIEVKLETLDTAVGASRVDLIKIDTEGNEVGVLRGAIRTLKNNPDVKLLIELNPDCLRAGSSSVEELLDLIYELGFTIYLVDEERWLLEKIEDTEKWKEVFGERVYANILCLPSKKQIEFISVSHTAQLGGAEKSLVTLIEETKELGAVHHVVLPGHGALEAELKRKGISHEFIDFRWWCYADNKDFESDASLNGEASYELFKIFKRRSPDYVLTNTITVPWAAVAASSANIPHIWSIHEFGNLDHKFKFEYDYDRVLTIIDNLSDLVLTNSEAVTSQISRVIDRKKVLHLPHSIAISPAQNSHSRKSLYPQPDGLKLLLVGRITPSKGQMEAVEAVSQILEGEDADVSLLLLGSREDRAYVREISKIIESSIKLKRHIRLVEHVKDPQPYYEAADIVLVCSENEAFGRVTAEAMLYKKPVIGTNSGGTAEMVEHMGTGLLYPHGDSVELKNAILFFANNPKKVKQMGEAGYARAVKKHNPLQYSHKLYDYLRSEMKFSDKKWLYEKLMAYSDALRKEFEAATKQSEQDYRSAMKELASLRGTNQHLAESKERLYSELEAIKNSRGWRILSLGYTAKHKFKKLLG
jgi:FkbM family methyltransferase